MNEQLLGCEQGAPSTPLILHLPDVDSVLRQADTENFTVASRFLPFAVRNHLLAVYGFARLADDIGDEAEGDRLMSLDWLASELDRVGAWRGHPSDACSG